MTEMITGVDLIQEQIKAAQGEVLRFKQEDIKIKVRALRLLMAHCGGGTRLLLSPVEARRSAHPRRRSRHSHGAQGHAIECRINAEDPFKNFRPGPGRVIGYLPPGGPNVRMDSHLYPDYLVRPLQGLARTFLCGDSGPVGAGRCHMPLCWKYYMLGCLVVITCNA